MRPPPKLRRWNWRSRAVRGAIWQAALVAAIALVFWFLTRNTLENMRVRGIQSGFEFLLQPAGFGIGESVIEFDSGDPYWKAFAAGLANTLRASLAGIVLTTLFGTLIGIGRLSRNFLVRTLCAGYVELFRNVPVLLQLLVWYLLLTSWLPDTADALQPIAGVLLSKNGLSFPLPVWEPGHALTLSGLLLGVVLAWRHARRARAAFEHSGQPHEAFWPVLGLVCVTTLAGWVAGGMPAVLDLPLPGELNIAGGGSVTPEFLAVTIGLTLYTAAFVAEAVRAGIQAVPHGQVEAAGALGLTRAQSLRLVLLPQALRVIIPPLTNQYLNLTKNSSLAVAVGYPDLVSISNTTLNQSGRAVECIAVIMAVYLLLSLATALFMNWRDARAAIRER
jgi:general L-amino acid transport system permease protein